MMGTRIYSKQYPKKECSREYEKIFPEEEKWAKPSLTEVPGWREKQERFIQRAIEVAEQCRYDIKIAEQDHTVVVELALDLPVAARDWMDLIKMSDSLYVFEGRKNRDVTLYLSFLTHSVSVDGKPV